MASTLPYVTRPGAMVKILDKIKAAKEPDRFNKDFLETKLGFRGGNNVQFIPLGKKLGLLNTDASPTDLYKKFRNNTYSKAAMATAIKTGYSEAFERNEYAGSLSKEKFKELIVEITGRAKDDEVVRRICLTFESLKELADFEATLDDGIPEKPLENKPPKPPSNEELKDINMNLAYTINLVLPKTDDPAVFNAIFNSLRENLLRK